jgi:hypothetical protein
MMCSVAMSCWIDFQSASVVGGPGHTMFTGHESLQLFSLGLPQSLCVPHKLPSVQGCKWKLMLSLKRSQMTYCVIQVTTLSFIYSESMRLKDLTLNVFTWRPHAHRVMKVSFHSCLICSCSTEKLQMYYTLKLLHVFLNTLYSVHKTTQYCQVQTVKCIYLATVNIMETYQSW